ncbi:MAG: c-type cytochrome [Pedosphaera sp.]|nr:c-type cytochrome [Pedosphaera sp.]
MNSRPSLDVTTSLSLGLTLFVASGHAVTAPASPADELASFVLADSALTIELVAAEPNIVSPVAIAWDARGRMFIAEMRDYPNAATGGSIRILEDRDSDGDFEHTTPYASGLSFPNGVLPWNDGVLVTAAPDILFLRDTNGDGIADERRVLFTGFGTGNQQLRVNGLTWGLDGWIYGANGRSDGAIRRGNDPTGAPISLRGRDFRFKPDTLEFETLAGRSQFGLARDDWGNRFLSWNTIPLRHEVFPDHFLANNPNLPAGDVLSDCLPAEDDGQVFPRTAPPLVFNNESASHFNALSGLTFFRGNALGDAYRNSVFVAESLRNLVHRRVVVPDGPTFRAERREVSAEFLVSTDPWFHPVNFATGPDGALYIVDFYRQFVEHPDWVALDTRAQVTWDTGKQHGRIWRVRRRVNSNPTEKTVLAQLNGTPRDLVYTLRSSNGWIRDTAQRLLLERREENASSSLLKLVRGKSAPETRVAALHSLKTLGRLTPEILHEAARDHEPRVREVGVWLSLEKFPESILQNAKQKQPVDSRLSLAALQRLARDSDDRVRLVTALAARNLSNPHDREPLLDAIANGTTNRWIRLAAASSSLSTNSPWISGLLMRRSAEKTAKPPGIVTAVDPDRESVVGRFQPALSLTGDRQKGATHFSRLCLSCHFVQGRGQRVGPDLSGISTRPAETLLTDILDPNRAVSPDYITWELTTADGETVTGLLASETQTRVTLRHAGAPDEAFARSRIRELKATGRSLMPVGIEAGLSAQDIADLLAFLRKPEGALP